MYIPELQEMTRQFCEDGTGASVKIPSTVNDWVKIALEGPMTVYAYLWNREDEEVVAW